MSKFHSLLAIACLAMPAAILAQTDIDIPTAPPQDAIMASASEIQAMLDWASEAFTGGKPPGRQPAVRVELKRQDHSVLRFGQSCIETPLRIGRREFQHGLGTHANSEIILHLPSAARKFQAWAGIDNNSDTGGQRGSVQFMVEIGGQVVFHTPTLRGGGEPVAVEVDIPAGTSQLVLKVDSTPDGPGHDQADWAEARILLADGQSVWADEDRPHFLTGTPPFSFLYGGVSSTDLLPDWKRAASSREERNRLLHAIVWRDPKTSLKITASVTVFKPYAAAEWLLEFENAGSNDSPIIENIQALDTRLRTGYARKPVVLHHLTGDICGESSWLPLETVIDPLKPVTLAPAGGRSSNGAFPFFNLQYGGEGLIAAIGWSGQWAARLERAAGGPVRLQGGLEKTRLKLHPGERIRSPRILVMPWQGDRLAAHNRWRRLLLFEYSPRQNGRPLQLPVAMQCFDRYSRTVPEWATAAGQLRAVRATRESGCDTHWLDAAWFEGDFPNGVGNWFCKGVFPNGLKPISDAAHTLGLKFMVWFEPERVAPNTQIAREHPEFVFGGSKGGLFKLNDPAARRWMTDLLSDRIGEFALDIYRNDFNIDPLGFWRGNDAADRQGMTEIRYVEGHYAMWDELLARHPGLWIDNCASGGRRIDLETIQRSAPLWRSDTGCSPGHADWDQIQTYGLSHYLPLFTSCAWEPDAYTLRSTATAGIICQFNFLDEKYSASHARAALDEIKANRKFWYGDYYPLTSCATGALALVAFQLHRADLDSGLVLAFRRAECPHSAVQVNLRGLNPGQSYLVELIDDARVARQLTATGRELASDWELRLPRKGQSLLLRYGRNGH